MAIPRTLPAALAALAALLLLVLLAVAASAPAAEARTCRAPAGMAKLSADRASCRTAARVARRALAVRRDTRRYAGTRRCRGSFCIVLSGWRCRPMRSPKPKERCVRRRAKVTWVLRG